MKKCETKLSSWSITNVESRIDIKLIMLETDIKQIPFIKNHIDFINQHQRVTQKDNY